METFTDDTVVALASFLSPHDMLSLALTCKRFGAKNFETGEEGARQSVTHNICNNTSLMAVAARTVLYAKWSDEEKKALPRRGDESWIGTYHEFLLVFRLPLQFDKVVGQLIEHVEGRHKKAVIAQADSDMESDHYSPLHGTAICTNIMRAGKHYVSFQVNDDDPSTNYGIRCGIMRPTTNDITSLECCSPVHHDLSRFSLKEYEMLYGDDNVDCCMLDTIFGHFLSRKRWKKWERSELIAMDREQREHAKLQNKSQSSSWEGQEPSQVNSFKIGLALDLLDEGTLDVYKNDRRLGTIKTGLVGEYCWVVTISPDEHDSVDVTISRQETKEEEKRNDSIEEIASFFEHLKDIAVEESKEGKKFVETCNNIAKDGAVEGDSLKEKLTTLIGNHHNKRE